MTELLQVELGEKSYEIITGNHLVENAGSLIVSVIPRPKVIIITDANVAKLYLNTLTASLEKVGIKHNTLILPPGESSKSFTELEKLLENILGFSPDRNCTLLALGGGVVGDITGFAASIILRGIPFIQIPTTLLAQVDSSVGGKTGINSRYGKNLVGSFYQPSMVIADTAMLATLPKREFLAGYAEVVKYGIINDYPFFVWLEAHGEKAIQGDMAALSHIVSESCKAKADIVAQDERESGIRAILNFGHTLGHALEAETGYSNILLHGEAVAIGMVLAMRLSVMRSLCSMEDYSRVKMLLDTAGLKTSPCQLRPEWDNNRLIEHCYHDKKAKDGGLTFILSQGIGKSVIANDVTRKELQMLLGQAI